MRVGPVTANRAPRRSWVRRARLRRWILVPWAVVTSVALLAATVHLASRFPRLAVLNAPPSLGLGEAAFLLEPLPPGVTFVPLRAEFLRDVLGEGLGAFLGPGASPSHPGALALRTPAGEDAPGEVGPGPSPTTTTTLLGPIEPPLPRFSRLGVAMAADRTTVRPGEHVTYTIRVRNVGTGEFRGELQVESHHPFWTTDSTTPCGELGVEPDPDHPCVNPPAPVPGSPTDDVHTARFSFGGPIARGDELTFSFRVRVNPGTPENTRIENHAHLDVLGDGEGPTTSNRVVVTVR